METFSKVYESFDAQADEGGAFVVGDPQHVAEKIIRHSQALGGIDSDGEEANEVSNTQTIE